MAVCENMNKNQAWSPSLSVFVIQDLMAVKVAELEMCIPVFSPQLLAVGKQKPLFLILNNAWLSVYEVMGSLWLPESLSFLPLEAKHSCCPSSQSRSLGATSFPSKSCTDLAD